MDQFSSKKRFIFSKNFFYYLCVIFSSFLITLLFLIFLVNTLRSISSLYFVYFTEGQVLTLARMLAESGNYFFNVNEFPYVHAPYPPVYVGLVALGIKFFGLSYIFGRVISLLSALGILITLFIVFFRKSREFFLSCGFAILFLAPEFVIKWSSLVRVDMLVSFFSILGLVVFHYFHKKSSPMKYIGILILVLAFFTKQNSLYAPLSILIYTFFINKKDFFYICLVYFIPIFSVFSLLNYLTNGEFFLHLVLFEAFMPLSLNELPNIYLSFIKNYAPFFVLLVFNIFVFKKNRLFSIYAIIAFLGIFTRSKPGADINYFIEPYTALLLISGLTVLEIFQKYKEDKIKYFIAPIFTLLLFLLVPLNVLDDIIKEPFLSSGYEKKQRIDQYVEQADNLILSEDLGFVATKKNKLPNFDAFKLYYLLQYGMWSEQEVLQRCNNKDYKLVIVGNSVRQFDNLMRCLTEKYEIVYINDYTLYKPRIGD